MLLAISGLCMCSLAGGLFSRLSSEKAAVIELADEIRMLKFEDQLLARDYGAELAKAIDLLGNKDVIADLERIGQINKLNKSSYPVVTLRGDNFAYGLSIERSKLYERIALWKAQLAFLQGVIEQKGRKSGTSFYQ